MSTTRIPPREDLLRYIRRFCEPETCAAIELGWLQNHLGRTVDASDVIRDLWRDGLVEPTFAENDDGLFGVERFGIDSPFGERTQFVLSTAGYAAIERLLETREQKDPEPPLLPPPSVLVEVGNAISAKLLETFARHPERLHQLSPRKFEELVAELFSKEGFSVELTRATKDGGRDIFAVRSHAFGRELVIAECKRYAPRNPVGVHYVRALYGVLEKERASRAVLATTSRFTKGAWDLAEEIRWRMSLKDYKCLKKWIQSLFPDGAGGDGG